MAATSIRITVISTPVDIRRTAVVCLNTLGVIRLRDRVGVWRAAALTYWRSRKRKPEAVTVPSRDRGPGG